MGFGWNITSTLKSEKEAENEVLNFISAATVQTSRNFLLRFAILLRTKLVTKANQMHQILHQVQIRLRMMLIRYNNILSQKQSTFGTLNFHFFK